MEHTETYSIRVVEDLRRSLANVVSRWRSYTELSEKGDDEWEREFSRLEDDLSLARGLFSEVEILSKGIISASMFILRDYLYKFYYLYKCSQASNVLEVPDTVYEVLVRGIERGLLDKDWSVAK